MSISAAVQDLFLKKRGGRDEPPGGQGLRNKIFFFRCEYKLSVTIKRLSISTMKKDKLTRTHPCNIVMKGHHNHSIQSAAALKELRVHPDVSDQFEEYFGQGMAVCQAARVHSMKRAAAGDLLEMARNDKTPSKRTVSYMHKRWQKGHGGEENKDMEEVLQRYASDHPEVTIKTERLEADSAIVVVTPLHRRVHQEVREAGEVVFVESTASVDRLDTVVLALLCATPAGALPLGFVLVSSQDQATLTAGEFAYSVKHVRTYGSQCVHS